MPRSARSALAPFCLGIVVAVVVFGCARAPAVPMAAGGQGSIEGTIVSIDTKPWQYDGNAVIVVNTADHGRVEVQLPARWNLCAAPAVDVNALSVGMRVSATGTVGGEGEVVVCQDAAHRLVPRS